MPEIEVRRFIGVPFVDGGRSFEGADCWGLVMLVYASLERELPDYRISCFDTARIGQEIRRESPSWVEVRAPKAGDIVVLAMDERMPGLCNHVGVCLGDGMFLHTLAKTGCQAARLEHPYWRNKIEGFYRQRGAA